MRKHEEQKIKPISRIRELNQYRADPGSIERHENLSKKKALEDQALST
jgi:hypothetical protein